MFIILGGFVFGKGVELLINDVRPFGLSNLRGFFFFNLSLIHSAFLLNLSINYC